MTLKAEDPEFFEYVGTEPGTHQLAHDPFTVLGFELVVLEPGQQHRVEAAAREVACVVLTGVAEMKVGTHLFESVGGRTSVFDGPPDMVYVPAGSSVEISTAAGVEVAVCSARTDTMSDSAIEPYRVDSSEVASGTWGGGNTTRTYDFMIDAVRPSQQLFLAEVTVRDGRWATYPPHKHEQNPAENEELFQEEYYFYRVDPEQGFGFAGLYGGQVGAEKAFMIRNNSLHKIPFGYHTLTAAPGYAVWYLAAYAGHTKAAQPWVDPDHRWFTATPAPGEAGSDRA